MSTYEKLRTSFDRLAQRLYNLEFDLNLDIQYDYVPEHSIKDILSAEILTCDPEDALDLLLHYIGVINKVIQSVPSIISRFNFSSITDFGAGTQVTSDQIKQLVQDRISGELEYYKKELERIHEQVLVKNEELGDVRFSNAGFKIILNLSNEQVGSFFETLINSKIILMEKEDGSELKPHDLAKFICLNFFNKKGKPMTISAMATNYLHCKKPIDKKQISVLINELNNLKSV